MQEITTEVMSSQVKKIVTHKKFGSSPLFTIRFVRPTRPIYNHTMTFVIFYSHFLLSTLPLYILFIPITLIHNIFFYNSKVVEVEKAYY